MAAEEHRVVVVWSLRDEYTIPAKGMVRVHREAIDYTRGGIRQMDLYGRSLRTVGDETRALSLGFRQLGGLLVSISIMSFVANLIIRRLAHVQLTLTEAQERYTKAVREHGAFSEQAITASRRLELAHKDLAIATREQNTQIILYSLQMLVLGSRVVDVVRSFEAANVAQVANTVITSGAAVVDAIHAGILWTKAHAIGFLKAGLIGLAIAMGAYIAVTAKAVSETQKLRKEIGEAPSYGLVKSLEDVQAVFRGMPRTPIRFEGAHFHVDEGLGVEAGIDEYARRLKDEWRRRSPE